MFRTVGQPALRDAVLPRELLRLPAELARVDALVDDAAFFGPFVPFFEWIHAVGQLTTNASNLR